MDYSIFDPSTMISTASLGIIPSLGDAYPALQAAELTAHAAGKILYIDPGVYNLSHPLELQDGDTLAAELGKVILGPDQGNVNLLGNKLDSSGETSNVTVANIIFDGGYTSSSSPIVGVPSSTNSLATFYIVSGINFVSDTFENAPYIGVLLSNADNTGFYDCTFSSIGTAPNANSSTNTNPYSQGVAFTGSNIKPSIGNFVVGCYFTDIGLDAVSATDQTSFLISNSSLTNLEIQPTTFWTQYTAGSAGIYLSNDTQSSVLGNTISNASGSGIDIANDGTLVIQDNIVIDSNGPGINIAGSNTITIQDNVLNNNNQAEYTWLSAAAITIADHAWGQAGPDSANVMITQNVATNTGGNTSQFWAVQINTEAHPLGLYIWSNLFSGNSLQNSYGLSGVFDGYFQPRTETIVSAPLDTGVLSAPPAFIYVGGATNGSSTRSDTRATLAANGVSSRSALRSTV